MASELIYERGFQAAYQNMGLWLVSKGGRERGRFTSERDALPNPCRMSMVRKEGVAECSFILEGMVDVWEEERVDDDQER